MGSRREHENGGDALVQRRNTPPPTHLDSLLDTSFQSDGSTTSDDVRPHAPPPHGLLATPHISPDSVTPSSSGASSSQQSTGSSVYSTDSGLGMELDLLQRQSLAIAQDLINRALDPNGYGKQPAKTKLLGRMRELVDELAAKHDHDFQSMARNVTVFNNEIAVDLEDGISVSRASTLGSAINVPRSIPEQNALDYMDECAVDGVSVATASANSGQIVRAVAAEMFSDNNFNFGRVIALFTFVAVWARYLHDRKLLDAYDAQRLPSAIADYVVNNAVGTWMIQHHGWSGLIEHFSEDANWESRFFKGLVVTGVGLGLLAGVFALKPHV